MFRDTSLSTDLIGPLPNGGYETFTVSVTIPVECGLVYDGHGGSNGDFGHQPDGLL